MGLTIRVFAVEDRGILKYLNYLKSTEFRDATVELCDPYRYVPSRADIHLHIDIPVRAAIPWAGFNAFAALNVTDEFNWTKTEMNLMLNRDALEDRDLALRELRWMVRKAQKHAGQPTLPVAPAPGTPPPKIGIITVTRNRPQWWYNMVKNVVEQEWPVSRLEWIIVDDSDADKRLRPQVEKLQENARALTIKYVELDTPTTIGEKRNIACRAASTDVTIFACMDDDDHYPSSSLALRASWLTRPNTDIAYCATLPMYDVRRYISAVNVPPLSEAPTSRISEATLCFTRAAWTEKEFPPVSMAEGDEFLYERVHRSVEMPSAGVIVSFIHSGNTSSRRIPADQEPNGSHYGFSDQYFQWLCETGGAVAPVTPSE